MAKRTFEKMEVVYVTGKGLTPLPKDEADALLEPVIEDIKARRSAKASKKQDSGRHKGVHKKGVQKWKS